MSFASGVELPGVTPPLPRSIWVVAWASLAGQVVTLLRQGVRLDDDTSLVLSVVLGGLARFHNSDWYAWQRTRPADHEGPSISQLVAIGVFVGVLGGLSGPVDDGLRVRISAADRR